MKFLQKLKSASETALDKTNKYLEKKAAEKLCWELSDETTVWEGIPLRRLRAKKSFWIRDRSFQKGQLGGWKDEETTLDREAWIADDAIVIDSWLDKETLISNTALVIKSHLPKRSVVKGHALSVGKFVLKSPFVITGNTECIDENFYWSNRKYHECIALHKANYQLIPETQIQKTQTQKNSSPSLKDTAIDTTSIAMIASKNPVLKGAGMAAYFLNNTKKKSPA